MTITPLDARLRKPSLFFFGTQSALLRQHRLVKAQFLAVFSRFKRGNRASKTALYSNLSGAWTG
jgi:hypothetical protein